MDPKNNETFVEPKGMKDSIRSKHFFAVSGEGISQKLVEFDVDKDITIVGRDENCDLVLNDPKVSRRHLKIIAEDDTTIRVLDMGSSNGTYVNEVKTDSKTLKYGDEVIVGNTKLKYFLTEPEGTNKKKVYDLG